MKTQRPAKRTFVLTSGAEAYEALHDEIAAVGDDALLTISACIPFAHGIVRVAASRIEPLTPELERLPGLDMERIRKLPLYAAACQHAYLRARMPVPDDPRLPRLLDEATTLRKRLLATAEMLVQFGEVPEPHVAAIRSTHGHLEMAGGLERLALLFEEIWDSVESRVPLTLEMVARARSLAFELFALIGEKRLPPLPDPKSAQRMKLRAYTLLVKAYEECQRGVAYLRHHEGDAAWYTPSFYTKQRRSRTSHAGDVIAEAPIVTTPALHVVGELAPTG
jgi:hypothetical protein